LQINKIKNDKQIKSTAIRDKSGNLFVLQDGRANWQGRKSYSVNFARIFHALGSEELKKAEETGVLKINKDTGEVSDTPEARKFFLKSIRMSECSLRLGYKIDGEGAIKLFNAHFCRDRLCAICMWRLSRRLAWETNLIMDKYIADNPDMIPILLSLTVKNPRMGELAQMLDVICHGKSGAWQLLQKWLGRHGIKDYIRTVEVTLNDKTQSWHPHLHVLAFVPKDYFQKGNKNYISHEILKKEWQRVCKLDYEPYVDIRRCYDKSAGANERIKFDGDTRGVSLAGAIKETAKYCVKPLKLFANFENYNANGAEEKKEKLNIKDVVRELSEGLSGRRLRALGGKLKKIARELKLDTDENKKDLIHKDETGTAEAIWEEIYEYVFEDKEYYLTAREEIAESSSNPQRCGVDLESVPQNDTAVDLGADDAVVGSQLVRSGTDKLKEIFADGANIYSMKFEQGAKNFQAVGVEGLALASSIF
jgi:plasmid rolling circle replication initiator protein Rep